MIMDAWIQERSTFICIAGANSTQYTNVHHEATALPQVLIQKLVWNLPDPELFQEALEPGLEDIRAPQLLRN